MKNKEKKKDFKRVPAGALCFECEGATAITEFAGEGEDKKPQLNMTIYSGGIIKNHWYWDDLAMDLSGMSFSKKRFPILEGHDRNKKIAFHDGPPIVDKGVRANPDKSTFVSTPESEQFQLLSSEGFPYEASARVRPTVIERVQPDAFAEVNGFKLKGPATVFRKWELVEGSVCVFGFDRNTSSSAFSQEVELDCEFVGEEALESFNQNKGGKTTMDLDTLKQEHPDLYKTVREEGFADAKSQAETQFSDQVATVQGTVTQLQETVNQQAQTIDELKGTNLELAKENTLRAEAESKAKADRIWTAEFADSEIPKHMQDERISDRVQHTKFVDAETKQCDWNAFAEAVKGEVKKWEEDLGKLSSSVQGGGYHGNAGEENSGDDAALAEDNAWADDMVAMVEQQEE